jgi:hypothetical protein
VDAEVKGVGPAIAEEALKEAGQDIKQVQMQVRVML